MDNHGKNGISDKEKALQLGNVAQHVEPRFTWQDLGLPQDKMSQLRTVHEITSRFAAQLHRIFDRFSIAKSAT